MSALIAAAAKGPAINRVVFSAAPRVLATLLRLQIPRRNLINPRIGSMRLHTGPSNSTDLVRSRQLDKNLIARQDGTDAGQSKGSQDIKSILNMMNERKEARERKQKALDEDKAPYFYAIFLGVAILAAAYTFGAARAERRVEVERQDSENQQEQRHRHAEEEQHRRDAQREQERNRKRREAEHKYHAELQSIEWRL